MWSTYFGPAPFWPSANYHFPNLLPTSSTSVIIFATKQWQIRTMNLTQLKARNLPRTQAQTLTLTPTLGLKMKKTC